MRFPKNDELSNILHVVAAIPFGFALIAVVAQLMQNVA